MTLRPDECIVCGHPGLRPEGHAEWCEHVAERNRLHAEQFTVAVLPSSAGKTQA